MFNQSKLNAPEPELFMVEPETTTQNEVVETQPTDLTLSVEEEKSMKPEEPLTTIQNKSPVVDYTQFEPLSGFPDINDKIAFQVCFVFIFFILLSSFKYANQFFLNILNFSFLK